MDQCDAVATVKSNLRKVFSANMDNLKEAFERLMRNDPKHQENIRKLQTLMSSDNPSYEDVFAKLGGPDFQLEAEDDLDTILKKLVTTPQMALSSDEGRKKLFEVFDGELRNILSREGDEAMKSLVNGCQHDTNL